jgi:hypothetical protein
MNNRTGLLSGLFIITALFTGVLYAEPVRDCVLEGTVKKNNTDENRVYVAFHSYRPAEEGAPCKIRRSEKLRFKQPTGSQLDNATPGSKVEYRYTEDSEKGKTWELRDVSDRSPG